MPQTYKLTMGEQADITLNRLATERHTTVGEILRNAINTYATLHTHRADEIFVRYRNEEGSLIIKRIVIP